MKPIQICQHLGQGHIDAYYDELSGKEVRAVLKAGVAILGDEFRIFGYIADSCLGQEAHWRRRTGEVRDALEQRMLQSL